MEHKSPHHSGDKHVERQAPGKDLSDVLLGGQDGLVNTLGVILGVAAASSDIRIVLAGGFAAMFAESISMGAVAYTARMAEADYYDSEMAREKYEIKHMPEEERREVYDIYKAKGFEGKLLDDIVDKICSNEKQWLATMMSDELGLAPVDRKGAMRVGFVVGISALVGSFVPIIPFFFLGIREGIMVSMALSALTLFCFGAYQAEVTVGWWVRSGIQLALIGMISALAGYLIGVLFAAPPIG